MLKKFSVGVAEKHDVEVKVSYWSGSIRVFVDGKEVHETKVGMFAPGSNLPLIGFSFGELERDTLEARIDYSLAIIMRPKAWIYLDGVALDLAPNVVLA